MKAMQKVSRGSGFRGALLYAFERTDGKDKGKLIGGTMAGSTINSLSKEFGRFRILREDIEKPVWHQSLRLPEGDTLSSEKWNEVGHDYMKRMGFDKDINQYAFVLHDDNHIHIIANRININSQIWLGRNENLESSRHVAQIEKDHGLTITKNLKYEQDNKGNWKIEAGQETANRRANTTSSERHMDSIREQDAFMRGEAYEGSAKSRLSSRIYKALEDGTTISEFIRRIEADKQVRVYATVKKDEMVGFTFTYEDMVFKGSQVDASWKELTTNKGLYYDKDTDIGQLQEADRRASSIKSADRKPKQRPSKHATAENKNRDSSGRFSTDGDSIGDLERDLPEPKARLNEHTSGLSNSSSGTQQASSPIRESSQENTQASVRVIRPSISSLDTDGSISSSGVSRSVVLRTSSNSTADNHGSQTSPDTTSTTSTGASSSTATSSPGTDATKTPEEKLVARLKAHIQQIAKNGNYTFGEAASIWVKEEQRRIKEKLAVEPDWTPDKDLNKRLSDSTTQAPTPDFGTYDFDYYTTLGEQKEQYFADKRAKQAAKSNGNSNDDYSNDR